jgi:hypothetical protein
LQCLQTRGLRPLAKRKDEHAAANKYAKYTAVRTVKLPSDAEHAGNASSERNSYAKPVPFADPGRVCRADDARNDITDWDRDTLDAAL